MNKIITGIKSHGKKVLVEIDGEYRLFLYPKELKTGMFKFLNEEGYVVSEEMFETLITHVRNRGKRRIMHLLAKQDYPVAKLEGKLVGDGYVKEDIDAILMPFVIKGYVDDKQLVMRRIEGMKSTRSRKEIEFKLRRQGFDSTQVHEMIAEKMTEYDELAGALNLLNKKFALKKMKLEEGELKNKALGYLSRKGFSIDVCYKAYDQFMNGNEFVHKQI